MLIEKYELKVFTPPCEPGAERFAAKALLDVDISNLLPYLNTTLRGAVYYEQANVLTWKKGGHNIAFHAYEIATSNVEDRENAEKEIVGLVKLVNRTWEQRHQIKPSNSTRLRPTTMVIYQLLPKTNCKACGESTCWNFALKLTTSQAKLSDCLILNEEQYSTNLSSLKKIIVEAPSIG